MCTHYFSDDMLRWYFKQERKNNWDHSHFNQFQWLQVPFSFSKYRSHSAGTVLWLIFDEQVPSLQICITVLFSADLQTPRTALPGFPTTLPVFQNVSTHFFYPSTPMHTQSMPRSRHAAWIDKNGTLTERRVRHLERTVLGRYLLSCHTVTWSAINLCNMHDDVIKWKHFPRYWPFVRGIHRSPVNSPHKGQWRRALMFTLICARINGWVNNREAGDLRRYRPHYDVILMVVRIIRLLLLFQFFKFGPSSRAKCPSITCSSFRSQDALK